MSNFKSDFFKGYTNSKKREEVVMLKVLKKLIKDMLKQTKEESYSTDYGEGFKAGKIEALEEVLRLMPSK